jgi:hypothetical protein
MKLNSIRTIKYKKGNNDDIGKAGKKRRKLETLYMQGIIFMDEKKRIGINNMVRDIKKLQRCRFTSVDADIIKLLIQ